MPRALLPEVVRKCDTVKTRDEIIVLAHTAHNQECVANTACVAQHMQFQSLRAKCWEDGPGSRKRYKEGDSNRKAEDGGK